MLIKPKYYIEENAPLKFLKLLRITLVITLVWQVFAVFALFFGEFDWYSADYGIVRLILLFFAVTGLNRMEWKGVLAYYGAFFLSMIDGLITIGLYTYYGFPGESTDVVGQILASLIVFITVWIYFSKRRPLFAPIPKTMESSTFPWGRHKEEEMTGYTGEFYFQNHQYQRKETVLEVCFCRNCGSQLVPDSNFCSICGTQVIKEW